MFLLSGYELSLLIFNFLTFNTCGPCCPELSSYLDWLLELADRLLELADRLLELADRYLYTFLSLELLTAIVMMNFLLAVNYRYELGGGHKVLVDYSCLVCAASTQINVSDCFSYY